MSASPPPRAPVIHGTASSPKHRQPAVDGQRSRKRQRRSVENDRYRAFVSRVLAGLARRVAQADPEDVLLLASVRADVDLLLESAIRAQRERGEVSWSRLAAVLGVTKQAVQKRYGYGGRQPAVDVAGGEA